MSADDLPLGIVSTDNIKVSERREFWEASAVPLFGRLQLEAPSGQPFDASVVYAGLADLVLCWPSAGISHRVVRTDALARHDHRAYVKAVFQSKGSSVVEQCGRRAVLRPGEWSVYEVLEYLASGMTHQDILREFPYLTEQDIRAWLAFAADRERKLEMLNA